MVVGVVAFQGDVSEHFEMIRQAGAKPAFVRNPDELKAVDKLIIPGGESTTVGLFLQQTGLDRAIQKRAREGMPVWGTCMGAILMAKKLLDNPVEQPVLGLMDIGVRRNAYGRQKESFQCEVKIPAMGPGAFPCVFIRAPMIEETGPKVQTLAEFQGKPVLVREQNLMAGTFHSEIVKNAAVHRYFISEVAKTPQLDAGMKRQSCGG